MECNSPCTLVLCGKSLADNETAKAIKSNNTLKLPDKGNLSVVLHSELDGESAMEGSFKVDSFMNSLSTDTFGRLLIWSLRLASTHDVVSQYVLLYYFCCLFYALCFRLCFQLRLKGREIFKSSSLYSCHPIFKLNNDMWILFSFFFQMSNMKVKSVQ